MPKRITVGRMDDLEFGVARIRHGSAPSCNHTWNTRLRLPEYNQAHVSKTAIRDATTLLPLPKPAPVPAMEPRWRCSNQRIKPISVLAHPVQPLPLRALVGQVFSS